LARHSLFSKGNPLDAISPWLIENRYFKNRNSKPKTTWPTEMIYISFKGLFKDKFIDI
jgi:hypothetical protein